MHEQPKVPIIVDIKMGKHVLTTCTQYLGVILDNVLSLEHMVGKAVGNTNYRHVMLRKMRGRMSRPTATLVYKQTMLPVLDYCGFLYNGITEIQHKRLQMVQNRCLRTCLKTRREYHVVDLHRDTGTDYLCVRYDMQLLLLIYKYVYGSKHDAIGMGLEFQRPSAGGRVMRSSGTGLLKFPTSKLMGYRKSPLYRGIALWNALPKECRLAESKDSFRAKTKTVLLGFFEERQRAKGLRL